MVARPTGTKLIADNRRARHDYELLDRVEAGIVLTGTEVKSLREGRASLVDGYAAVKDGEVWLHNVHIPEYTQGTWTNHEPRRTRKLLLHRDQIRKLNAKTQESGLTVIPLALYFKDGYAKVEIGVARGKKSYDKRHSIAEREAKRDAARAMARRGRDD